MKFLELMLRQSTRAENLKLLITSFLCLIILSTKEIRGQHVITSPPRSDSAAVTSSLVRVSPTPTPLPQYTQCRTGPNTQAYDYIIITTDNVYLDISEPVQCSGFVTRWHYCHYLVGFRDAPAGLWPCVWRRSNSSEGGGGGEGFEVVGCNKITVISGEGEDYRCRSHDPTLNPDEVISVEEGDYIGFYVPDSGLFPALSLPDHEPGRFQMYRNESGFSSFLMESELRNVSCTPICGRALLSAEIRSDWIYSSIVHTPLPTPMMTDRLPESVSIDLVVPLTVSLVIAIGVTIVLIVTVVAMALYVNCKRRDLAEETRAVTSLKLRDMEYNDLYAFRNSNYVAHGKTKQTLLNVNENPAYDSATSSQEQLRPHSVGNAYIDSSIVMERNRLEHTYESLSDYHVHAVNVEVHGPDSEQ